MHSNQSTISSMTDPDEPIMPGRVYVSGGFSDVLVLNSTTLAEIDRIPLEAESHCRLSLLENPNDETSRWIAVSQGDLFTTSDRVLIYDVKTKDCVNRLIGVSGAGLETITNSSLSSNSIVVSSGHKKILVFDSISSDVLCEFQNPPVYTNRISHFPEWNRNKVFVGGKSPRLSQYDLNQEEECVRMGDYRGHSSHVYGLSASLSHQLFFSGSWDQTVKCWSFNQFDSCVNSVQLDKSCWSVKYLEDLQLICCGTRNEIEIFDIRNLSQRIRKVRKVGNGAVQDLDRIETDSSFSDPLCVSGSIGGIVSIWNPINGAVLQKQRCGGKVFGVRFLGPGHPRYGILLQQESLAKVSEVIESELETKREAMRFLEGAEQWENLSSLLESNGFSWETQLLEQVNSVAIFRSLVYPLPGARTTLLALEGFSGVDPSVVLQALLGNEPALLHEPRHLVDYYVFFYSLNLHDEANRVCDLVRNSELDLDLLVDLMTAAADREDKGMFPGLIAVECEFTIACLDALLPHREALNPKGKSPLLARAESWIFSFHTHSPSNTENEVPSSIPFTLLAARRLKRLNDFRQQNEEDSDDVIAAPPLTMKMVSCEGEVVGVHAIVMCSKFFQFVGDLRMDSVEVHSGLLLWKSELPIDALEGLASYAYSNDPLKMIPENTEDSLRRFIAILSMLSFLFREVYSHEAAIQHLVSELSPLFQTLYEEDQLHRALAICGKQVVTSFGVDFLEKLLQCVSDDDASALLPYQLPDLVCELMLLERFHSDVRFLGASRSRFCSFRKMEEEVHCSRDPGRIDELKVEILQGCMEMTSGDSIDLVRRFLFREEEEVEEEGEAEITDVDDDRSFLSLKPFVTIDGAELLTLWKRVTQREVDDLQNEEVTRSNIQELLEERLRRSLALLSPSRPSHVKHIVLQNVSLLQNSEASRALLTPHLEESVLDSLLCEDLSVVLPLWLREKLADSDENQPFLAALAQRVELLARMIARSSEEGEDSADGDGSSCVLHRFPNVCSQLLKISQDETNSSLFTRETNPMICDVFRSFGDISILLDQDLAGLCEFVILLKRADWSLCGEMSTALDDSSDLVGINRTFKLLVTMITLSDLGYDSECLGIVETKIIQASSSEACPKSLLLRRLAACGGVIPKIGFETMRRMFVSTGLLDEDEVAGLRDEGLETIVPRLAQFRNDNVVGRFVSLHLTDRLSRTFSDETVDCIELQSELVKSCVSVDSETLTLLREAVVSASRDSVLVSFVPQILEFVTTDLCVLLSLWHRMFVSGSSLSVPQLLLQSSLFDHISKVIVQEGRTSEDDVALCVVESAAEWRQSGCLHELAPAFHPRVDFDRLSSDDLGLLLHLLMDMISDEKPQLVAALEARIRFVSSRFYGSEEEEETILGCPSSLALLLLRTVHSDADFEARVECEKGRISNLFHHDGLDFSVLTLVSNSMDCLSSVIVELEVKLGAEDDLVVVMKERLSEATQRLQEDREATTQLIARLYLEQKRMKRRVEVLEDSQLRMNLQQEEQQRVKEQLLAISSQFEDWVRKQEEQ